MMQTLVESTSEFIKKCSFKIVGPIERNFHGHGKNDGFVLYELKNAVVFANIQTSAL